MRLYTSHRSNAAYRVRIALAHKGISYDPEYIQLAEDTGEERNPEYLQLNPLGMVPTLVDGRRVYHQPLAVLEYLEETYPQPPILPGSSRDRERIRSLSQVIAHHVDPMADPRTIAYLQHQMAIEEEGCRRWVQHWVTKGLTALEQLMAENPATDRYCHGELPTMADICLAPLVYGLKHIGWHFDPFPTIERVYRNCMKIDAFRSTAPDLQPDS